MNDDLKKDLDKLGQELGPYTSNTNTILWAINDLSKKMDDTQKESEKNFAFHSQSLLRYYHFSPVLSLLSPECLL